MPVYGKTSQNLWCVDSAVRVTAVPLINLSTIKGEAGETKQIMSHNQPLGFSAPKVFALTRRPPCHRKNNKDRSPKGFRFHSTMCSVVSFQLPVSTTFP